MPRRGFQRARKPEEKEVRRRAILDAARTMLDEAETSALSLNELGRRSGVSKSNLYRYFESREEVLLQLWVDEVRVLGNALESRFSSAYAGDIDKVIDIVVASFVAQPRLCELTAQVSPVLERNLSAEAVFRAKETLGTLTLRIAEVLHGKLAWLSLQDAAWMSGAIATWIAGIWPSVYPPKAVREALARTDLPDMRIDFPRDLERFVRTLINGLRPRKK